MVGPFKNRNSAGLSGVDPMTKTTISISELVWLLICPLLINFAMPSLSCCADNSTTSFKVCIESKYTERISSVSANTGIDVKKNAMNNDFAVMSVADA